MDSILQTSFVDLGRRFFSLLWLTDRCVSELIKNNIVPALLNIAGVLGIMKGINASSVGSRKIGIAFRN
jgi:hypothetical protein